MYRIVYLILSSFLILSCNFKSKEIVKLPYYNEPTFTPIFVSDSNINKIDTSQSIANFAFLNQDSTIITQEIFKNKIHIANFVFTSCGSICPVMTKNLKTVSDSLKYSKDIIFLSYSVTPWIDNPKKLKLYKERNEITNSNWHFLTGNKGKIYTLARQSYFAEEDIGFSKDSTEFLHTEHFLLIDKNKKIRGIYNGTLQIEMLNLINDINTLKEED